MSKTNIGAQTFIPMVQSILGTTVDGRPNFMALGWQTRVNHQPPMLGIGVHQSHASHRGIMESKHFSVNFPAKEYLKLNDLVGIVSGDKFDKAGLFDIFYGDPAHAPMINECNLCLDCTLVQQVDLPSNTIFIGEIVGAYADETILSDNVPDMGKMESMLLTMPDNRYWSVGEVIGKAWKDGMELKKPLIEQGKLKEIG